MDSNNPFSVYGYNSQSELLTIPTQVKPDYSDAAKEVFTGDELTVYFNDRQAPTPPIKFPLLSKGGKHDDDPDDPDNPVIITTESNPPLMRYAYSKGWCSDPDKMTKEECEAVTGIPSNFRNSGVVTFDEFEYFTNVTLISMDTFAENQDLISIVLPKSIKTIEANGFKNCINLTKVVLNDTLAELRASSFAGCETLTNIMIPGTVREVRNNMFTRCYSLDEVILGEGIVAIYNSVFQQCQMLTKISLPSTLKTIGSNCFSGCGWLSLIECLAMEAPTVAGGTISGTGVNPVLRIPRGATGYDTGFWLSLQTVFGFRIEEI